MPRDSDDSDSLSNSSFRAIRINRVNCNWLNAWYAVIYEKKVGAYVRGYSPLAPEKRRREVEQLRRVGFGVALVKKKRDCLHLYMNKVAY
jgi:hypothetical protein